MAESESAESDSSDEPDMPPEARCMNFEDCGNETPGGAELPNQVCDECLSRMRREDSPT